MKVINYIKITIYSILCFLSISSQANERQIQCKVVGISDGDTLTCLYQRNPLKIRLLYIDAPESAQPFGNRAKQALAQLVFKKEVRIISTGYDKYQRILGVVYDGQRNINLALVEQGMAWAYRQTQPIYQQAQAKAQANKIGLWRDSHPINPADWRASKRSESSQNLQTMPQNRPLTSGINCQQKISCAKMEKQGFSYAQAKYYFEQCGWRELDGNNDGIPCNRLYRQSQRR